MELTGQRLRPQKELLLPGRKDASSKLLDLRINRAGLMGILTQMQTPGHVLEIEEPIGVYPNFFHMLTGTDSLPRFDRSQ
jgi:hypothetical protein